MTSAEDLPEVLLFNQAISSPRNYVYKIAGRYSNGLYQLSLEVTDHTDQGTFVSAFSLNSLLSYYYDNLDLAPSSLKMTLDWVKAAFGQRARLGSVTLEVDLSRGAPQLHARFPYQLDKSKPGIDIELSLPPEQRPLRGNLPAVVALGVRESITVAAIKREIETVQRLDDCEKQQKAYTAALHDAVKEEDGSGRIEELIDIFQKLEEGKTWEEICRRPEEMPSPILGISTRASDAKPAVPTNDQQQKGTISFTSSTHSSAVPRGNRGRLGRGIGRGRIAKSPTKIQR